MDKKKDYYEILEIEKDASIDDIKRAYRKLALKYHPDINKQDVDAKDKFIEIKEAYETLVDPQKRQIYDTVGHNPGNFDYNEVFNRDYSSFREILRQMFRKPQRMDPRYREPPEGMYI